MKEKSKKKIMKNVKGITLIALVVTIIVLLILAVVSINIAVNGGIILKAKNATAKYQEATANETDSLNQIESEMDKLSNGDSNEIPTADLKASRTAKTVFTTKTDVTDALGNKARIPVGFKIAYDSAETIPGGLVIEDVSAGDSTSVGNQFVWIPCTLDGANGSVQLGRYTFSTTDGTPTLVQAGSDYAKDVAINTDFHELQTSSYGNTTAKSLANFVTSVGTNGGYYLARYEAGKTTDTSKCVSKNNVAVYNNITQPNSATIARNMYSSNVTSDLVNSYAWDTAIVYIEKCGTNANYANQRGESTDDNLANTGMTNLTSTSAIDVQCNIYDMAGNVKEWTTESCSATGVACVFRGGSYTGSNDCTAVRSHGGTGLTNGIGFRPLLYL